MSEIVIYGCGQTKAIMLNYCSYWLSKNTTPWLRQFVYPSAILGDVQGGTNSSQGATGWTAALEGVFDPIQGRAGKMKLYNGIFLQGCFKSTVTLLSPVKNLGFLVRVLPKWLWQDPTEPTKGSVAWWYRAARAQPGHSQGTARGFKWLWFSCEPRCDFPSRMRWWLPLRSCTRGWDNARKNAGTVAGTCIASLQQTLVEETLKCFQIQINRYQQILFSCVFQLSVHHLWIIWENSGRSLSGPFPPLLPSYSSPWPRLCPFWSSSRLGGIRRGRRSRRRWRRPCRWTHRGDASASSPSSDQGLGWLGHFLKKNRGKPRKTISPSPKFP